MARLAQAVFLALIGRILLGRAQETCHLPSCVNGKPMLDKRNHCKCVCDEGYGGRNCDKEDACKTIEGNPCQHGGLCQTDDEGDYYCDCMLGFIGPNCEDRNPCLIDKVHCLNGGTCQRLDDYDFICACQVPYDGDHCELLNLCHLDPGECLDRRTPDGAIESLCYPCGANTSPDGCIMLSYGSYECLCLPGFLAPLCEVAEVAINMSRITLPVLDMVQMQPHDFIVYAVDVPEDAYVGVAINVSSDFNIHISFRKDFRPDCDDVVSQWETFLPPLTDVPVQDLRYAESNPVERVGNFVLATTELKHKTAGRHYAVFWPEWQTNNQVSRWNPKRPVEVTFDYDIYYVDCVTREELEFGIHRSIDIQPDGDCYATGNRSHIRFVTCDCRKLTYTDLTKHLIRLEHHPEVYLAVPLFTDLETCWIIPWIVLGCSILYILLLILACCIHYRKRRALGFFLLTDIWKIEKEHFYLLTVELGNHFLAATTANICCEIRGPCARIKLVLRDRTLFYKTFQGCEQNYLFSTREELGELEKLRIWHDNAGHAPDWYVSRIIVKNIKTKQSWYFCFGLWLTVSDYTMISSAEALTIRDVEKHRRNSCSTTLIEEFPDKHLALAPIFALPRSTYTYPERLTVLFLSIFVHMFVLIFFYGLYDDAGDDPIYFMEWGNSNFLHSHVVLYGFLAALITWPHILIMNWLFRHIWRRRVPTMMVCTDEPMIPPPPTPPPPVEPKMDDKVTVVAIPKEPQQELMPEEVEDFRIPSTSVSRTETWIGSYVTQRGKKGQPVHYMRPNPKQRVCKKVINEGLIGAVVEIKDDSLNRLVYKNARDNIETERRVAQDICSWYRGPLWPRPDSANASKMDDETEKGPMVIEKFTQTMEKAEPTSVHFKKEAEKRRRLHVELCQSMAAKGEFMLPKKASPFLWLICLAIMIATGIFVASLGIRYGLTRSIDWSYSLVWAVIFSFFVIEVVTIGIYCIIVHLLRKSRKGKSLEEIREEERFQLYWFLGHCCLPNRWPLNYFMLYSDNFFPPLTAFRMFVLRLEEIRKARLMKNLVDMIVFLIFVLCLNILVARIRTVEYYYTKENIEESLRVRMDDEGLPGSFWSVQSVSSFYDYVLKTLVEDTYGNLSDQVVRHIWHEYIIHTPEVLWLSNQVAILVGVIRIRQQRVGPAQCQSTDWIRSSGLAISCVGNFKDNLIISTKDMSSYGFNWTSLQSKAPLRSSHHRPRGKELNMEEELLERWSYWDASETESVTYMGHLNWHDGGGYVVDFTREKNQTVHILSQLRNSSWLDQRTRALFIEFTTYNPHVQLFNLHRFVLERSSYNSWVPSAQTVASKFYRSSDVHSVLLMIVLLACFLYFLQRRSFHLYKSYKKVGVRGLKQRWPWFDIFVALWGILMCCSYIYVNHSCWLKLEEVNEYHHRFVNLQPQAVYLLYVLYASGILLILALIMFWRLFIPSYRRWFVVGLTLRLTGRVVQGFFFFLFILLICFACSSHLAFGSKDEDFATLTRSIVNLLRGFKLASAMSYRQLEDHHRILGPVFYFVYYVVVYFLSYNVIVSVLTMGLQEAEDSASRRSFRHTYTRILWTHTKRILIPARIHRRYDTSTVYDLDPQRWSQMKQVLTKVLRGIHLANAARRERMWVMRTIADNLLQPYGQRIVGKREVHENWRTRHMKIPSDRIGEMKKGTIQLIKAKTGHEYTAEEQKSYDDYNDQLTRLRQERLDRALEKLDDCLSTLIEERLPKNPVSSVPVGGGQKSSLTIASFANKT